MAVGRTWDITAPCTNGYIKVWFQEDYFIDGNYSTLKVTKMAGCNTMINSQASQVNLVSAGTISIDGSQWYSWNSNNWVFGGSYTESEFMTWSGASYPSGLRINHNLDGSKTINVSLNITHFGTEANSGAGKGGSDSKNIELTNTHIHSYSSTVTKQPTCTATGVRTYTCSVCAHSYTESVDMIAHKWNSGLITTNPTYETNGVKTYTCSACNGTKTESVAKLPPTIYIHNGNDWETYGIYIHNGNDWEAYAVYIDDGEKFVAYC